MSSDLFSLFSHIRASLHALAEFKGVELPEPTKPSQDQSDYEAVWESVANNLAALDKDFGERMRRFAVPASAQDNRERLAGLAARLREMADSVRPREVA
jgi:hypothetical protein